MLKPVLIFGLFGPLIGTIALYAILLSVGAASGRPLRYERMFDDVAGTLWLGWLLGVLPAILTGALLTRWYTSPTLPLLVLKSAAIGAVVSLVFFGFIFGVALFGPESIDRHLLRLFAPFAVAGGVAAVVCAMLSRGYWRYSS